MAKAEYMMLSVALMKMIDKSESLFFHKEGLCCGRNEARDILFFAACDEFNEESERVHKRRWGKGGKNCHSAH